MALEPPGELPSEFFIKWLPEVDFKWPWSFLGISDQFLLRTFHQIPLLNPYSKVIGTWVWSLLGSPLQISSLSPLKNQWQVAMEPTGQLPSDFLIDSLSKFIGTYLWRPLGSFLQIASANQF